eukprot:762471-Hanusia_phi.AAC.1
MQQGGGGISTPTAGWGGKQPGTALGEGRCVPSPQPGGLGSQCDGMSSGAKAADGSSMTASESGCWKVRARACRGSEGGQGTSAQQVAGLLADSLGLYGGKGGGVDEVGLGAIAGEGEVLASQGGEQASANLVGSPQSAPVVEDEVVHGPGAGRSRASTGCSHGCTPAADFGVCEAERGEREAKEGVSTASDDDSREAQQTLAVSPDDEKLLGMQPESGGAGRPGAMHERAELAKLPERPTQDALISAYLLERRDAHAELLGYQLLGEVEVEAELGECDTGEGGGELLEDGESKCLRYGYLGYSSK